ncbi:MAG TPA: glutamate--tRNA ligase [Candidatus Binatia bacterium]|jgi:glutamyl-tRNA synthetase|nr:glutamate--tRNA ligase [Candidatus Binatia bacterium]
MSVRTRFAPSPTGYLHIGGARTALFSYLFARRHGGTFVLRIEDTDRERSTPASIQAIIDSLNWLGLDWDEGPFFQTERFDLYQAHAERLLLTGQAYRCWCTAEEIAARRQAVASTGHRSGYDRTCRDLAHAPAGRNAFALRFRTPIEGETVVDDDVKGRVTFQNAELDDFVIQRTDGSPIYNFCVVVDDVEMRISHVIRGDDHLTNTPRQILLYEALGASLPRFAHVPLILGLDKARLSKRHGATSVMQYHDEGYLPAALVNFLARLGWSHGDQELFTRAELIEHFSLENVGTSAAIFNPEKLLWTNFQYLKATPPLELTTMVQPFLERAGLPVPSDTAWMARAVETVRERAKTLVELADALRIYVAPKIAIQPKAASQHLRPEIAPVLADLTSALEAVHGWDVDSIEQAFQETIARHGLALGKLAQPVRVAVTGGTVSPGIFEVLDVLGRERALARLRAAQERLAP